MARRPAPPEPDPAAATSARGLLALRGLGAPTLRALLVRARDVAASPPPADLHRGRLVANLFFEDSTRTRTSFSVAARRLGAEVVDLVGASSSVNKGETLIDTARNVEAMGVDALVVRSRQAGVPSSIAARVAVPVINAGDGRHEHPTQGLLDALAFAEAHGRDDFDFSGLTLAIVGDAAASRVARSAIAAFATLGAGVVCVGPPALAPSSLADLGAGVARDLDEILPRVDAVMMLRIQFERRDGAANPAPASADTPRQSPIASVREFRARFALTPERAERLKPGAVVMHPGPINRGIELDAAVADGPRSIILRQVALGVAVRMAVLADCLGA